MSVPESGQVEVELALILNDNGGYSFPIEFQYSKNDEKKIVQFPQLVFAGEQLLVTNQPVDQVVAVNEASKIKGKEISGVEEESNKKESIVGSSVAVTEPVSDEVEGFSSFAILKKNYIISD